MKLTVKTVLLLIAIIVALTACSDANPEIFDGNFINESGTVDFDGINVTFRVNLDSGNGVNTSENYLGYNFNTTFSDLAVQRVSDVQKSFNCTVNITSEGDLTRFQLLAASGNADCDIFLGPSFNAFNWAKAGFLIGMSELTEYIDYKDSEKWGTPNILESAFYKDDLYGLTPNAWPEQNYTSFGYPLVANIDLILANGARNPRELVEQGVWVWDTFHEELLTNTIVEGTATKTYGLMAHHPYFTEMILLSNGVRLAKVDESGNYYCGYYSDASLRAINEARNIWYGEYAHTVSKELAGTSTELMLSYVEGTASYAFLPTHFIFGVYGEVSKTLDNFAILPTPTGPDVDVGYVAGLYHTMYYTIVFPVFSDKTEAAAVLANAIYEPLPGFETQDDIKAYMSRNYFFDERDADVFFKIYENSTHNYFYPTGGRSRTIPNQICSTESPVSQILESNKSLMDELFTDYIAPCLDVYKVLWVDYGDMFK